jgi:hypothetical protein
MSLICLLNTEELLDSAGQPFDSQVNQDSVNPTRTKPVRLFSGDGETRYSAFEFLFKGNAADSIDLRWYFEFWGDAIASSLRTPPNARVLTNYPAGADWSREVTEEVTAGTGTVDHYAVTRQTTLTIAAGKSGASIWVPMLFHAPWVRLAVYTAAAFPTGAHLRILAHVGGHDEQEYTEVNNQLPYAYDAA